MNNIKAIIFDMDGVIADTMNDHTKLEAAILERYNIHLTPKELEKKYAGIRVTEIFEQELSKQTKPYNAEKLATEKRQQMMELAKKGIKPIPGIHQLLRTLQKEKYKLAVGSASQEPYVNKVLEGLNIKEYFKAIAAGNMVKKGKPEPDIFLLAAKKLKTKPEECLVIEDGINGMVAAKKAGMKCIGLVPLMEEGYPANKLVTSLKDITTTMIKEF